jgi:sialic acid synthase SpsE
MSPKMVKIASPELNYTGLLEEIAQWEIPVLLSTGVSKLSDIETAIDIFKEKKNICLLHCVTSYPAPETEYNLRLLPSLTNIFGVPVGISDHSSDPELIPALGVCMGASVIEKHFCLSRKDPGLDDPIALPPDEFSKMVKAVRLSAKTDPEKTYKNYCKKKNRAFIEKILGSGIKELAPCERANYKYTNRSIHAMRDINAGEILNKGDYAVLRTEKNLRPGLEPCREKDIEGRAVKNFIPSGEGIRFEDI